MSLPINFRKISRAEYDEAIDWYESVRTNLGDRFEREVEAVLAIAADSPQRFPLVESDVREAAVSGFPFCIYYRVRENRLVVIAVYHQARNPDHLKSRIES